MANYERYDITKYFRIDIGSIKSNKPLPCTIYIFLQKNQRIILYKNKGDTFEEKRLQSFQSKKFNNFFISKDSIEVFNKFVEEEDATTINSFEEIEEGSTAINAFEEIEDELVKLTGSQEEDKSFQKISGASENEDDILILKSQFLIHDDKSTFQISGKEALEEMKTLISSTTYDSHKESLRLITGSIFDEKHMQKVFSSNLDDDSIDDITIDDEEVNETEETIEVENLNPSFLKKHQMILFQHSTFVSKKAIEFLNLLHLNDPYLKENLAVAAYLHDLGFIKLPGAAFTLFPDKLTQDMQEEYRKHPLLSYEIAVSKNILDPLVKRTVLEHHECYDGSGFPKGLKGRKISEGARILAIADALHGLIIKNSHLQKSQFEALKLLEEENLNSEQCRLDPNLLRKLICSYNNYSISNKGRKIRIQAPQINV